MSHSQRCAAGNSGGIGVARISSRSKEQRCRNCESLRGGVRTVYLSSVSVPIISTYLSARMMLSDTYTNVLEEKKKKPYWLEKASSLGQSAGKGSAQEESKRFFNTLIVLSLLYTHTLN